jgi:sodium transport system permease protein
MKSFTWLILKKELLDIFRDRRSIIMTFALPLVLYPLMFLFIGSQAKAEIDGPSMTRIYIDSYVAGILDDPIFDDFNHTIVETHNSPADALADGSVDIVVTQERRSFSIDPNYVLRILYDPNRTSSAISAHHFSGLMAAYNQSAQAQALLEMGIDLDALAPLSFEMIALDDETGGAGLFLSIVLPMLLVILLSVGGMPTAVDLFAGEKERRTFEPLLCTAARRSDILAGKLGAVTIMSLLGALASGLGLLIGYLVSPSAMTLGLDDAQRLVLPASTILLALLIIMAMAVFFSGLHVLLSTYARTVKEASTYGSFVMLASYVPVFASMNKLGGDFELWSAFVPVMNVTGSLKMVLGGIHNPAYMAATLGSTAAFVGVVLLAGKYMFTKENIMLRA